MAKIKLAPIDDFINEYTRKLLVGWCADTALLSHDGKTIPLGSEGYIPGPFYDHAHAKGWVNKDAKILSIGWKTAAAYLRRGSL